MPSGLRRLLLVALLVFTLLMGAAGGVVLDRNVLADPFPSHEVSAGAQPELDLITEAWNAVHQNYVDQASVQDRKLTYGAISGMVDALGDTGHSTFLTPEMVAQERNYTQGELEGIGAEIQEKDNHVVITAPIDGSPAQKAGLKPGDVILKVDGQDMTGLPLDQVVSRILGPAGTQVTLTIRRPETNETKDFTITRARIQLKNVTWVMLPGTQIAHVRLSAFSQGVTAKLQAALADARKQGATGIILDMRNNPGGLLDGSIGVASLFLRDGNVLLEKNAKGETKEVAARTDGPKYDLPTVVLINEGTASASEIVAGALQDAGRARLVGQKTFGTGTVLLQFPLSDGSALMLATEEWLTPKGRVIWHQGIVPDVEVKLGSDAMPLTPDAERSMAPEAIRSSSDAQLLKALELLTQAPAP